MHSIDDSQALQNDERFKRAVKLFNSKEWYNAHDLLEELWHESIGPDRRALQGILQIAVAQLHLERNNYQGATILYGEGLGKLRQPGTTDLGIDMVALCECVEERLKRLQNQFELGTSKIPTLRQKN